MTLTRPQREALRVLHVGDDSFARVALLKLSLAIQPITIDHLVAKGMVERGKRYGQPAVRITPAGREEVTRERRTRDRKTGRSS